MITRKQKILATIFTLLFATVAAAQFFGIPRRVFAMVFTGPGTESIPALAFGDGDSGFFEPSDDTIRVSLNGSYQFEFTGGNVFRGSIGSGIINESPSATNPTLLPRATDFDTGSGWPADDQYSLIAGGVEGIRITETAGAITITHAGIDATHQNGTFTITFANACTTTPSETAQWARAGQIVSLFVPAFSCTSDAVSFVSGGEIPAVIRPDTDAIMAGVWVEDNGTFQIGCAEITSSGVLQLSLVAATGACPSSDWTASGTKAWAGSMMVYSLN